jgi:hypothetical protein
MPIEAASETDRAIGVIPAAPWRVKELSILPDYRLAVTFQDGTSGVADLSAVTSAHDRSMYEPLTDPSYFKQARLEMGVVTWPNGADLDPAWMNEELTQFRMWSVPF